MLTIVAGGVIGASLSFGFLGQSPANDVQPITRILYGGLTVTGESTLDDRLEEPQEIEPLETVPYRINFLTSAEMTTAITQLISERGQVAEVVGKNSVVVTDIRRVHEAVNALISELDTPTPQIMISAKIIFRTDLEAPGVNGFYTLRGFVSEDVEQKPIR